MKDFVLSPIPLSALEEIIKRCIHSEMGDRVLKTSKNSSKEEDYLTTEEAAQFLKVSLVSIHNWKRDKGLPFYRLGRSIRFKKIDLIAFTEKRQK